MINHRTNVGPFVKGLRAKMKNAGVASSAIELVVDQFLRNGRKVLKRIPAAAQKKALSHLVRPGDRAILLLTKSGKIRVFTQKAITALTDNGKRRQAQIAAAR